MLFSLRNRPATTASLPSLEFGCLDAKQHDITHNMEVKARAQSVDMLRRKSTKKQSYTISRPLDILPSLPYTDKPASRSMGDLLMNPPEQESTKHALPPTTPSRLRTMLARVSSATIAPLAFASSMFTSSNTSDKSSHTLHNGLPAVNQSQRLRSDTHISQTSSSKSKGLKRLTKLSVDIGVRPIRIHSTRKSSPPLRYCSPEVAQDPCESVASAMCMLLMGVKSLVYVPRLYG